MTLNFNETYRLPVNYSIVGKNMKKYQLIVIMLFFGCSSESITEESLIEKNNGLKYNKNTEKPYTGPVKGVNINGVYYTGSYRHGVRYGEWKTFHQNGLEKEVSYYSNGSLNGPFLLYHENGSESVNTNYKYGNENGKRLEYNNEGELIKEECYEIGKIVECLSSTSIIESKIESKENDFKNIVYRGNIFEASLTDLLNIIFNTNLIKNSIEWKSNTDIENEFYPNTDDLLTTQILEKVKIDNNLLVLFSSSVKDSFCHGCYGGMSLIMLSFISENRWESSYVDYFSAGGSWGRNASLDYIRNNGNSHPLFVFRYNDGGQGYYEDVINVFGFINGKIINILNSSSEENLLLNSNNSGNCCFSLDKEIKMEFEGIPFDEALSIMIEKYGKGYTFSWNDKIFNTYTEEDDPNGITEYCGEDSYSSYACYSTGSSYSFISNPSSYLDDLVFKISGTKEKRHIEPGSDLKGVSFKIDETHYYKFNEDSLKYILDREMSSLKYFNGDNWVTY